MVGFYRAFVALQAAKIMAGFRPKPGSRIDEDLPLGLKIGGSILFENATVFILAEGAGHQVRQPKEGVAKVSAWGRMPSNGNTLHRFYLDSGDEGDDLLQVVAGPDGKVVPGEIRLFRLIRELAPSTPEEWTVWLPGNPDDPNERYLVGYKQLDVPGGANYTRMWPQEGPEQVVPIELQESVNADPYGSDTVFVTHRAMLYGRSLPRPETFLPGTQVPDEWIWLQVSEHQDQAMVQLYAGLTIEPGDLRVVQPGA